MNTMQAIAKLIRPRSIAVIGASADAAKTSARPIAYLQKHGYRGVIYPVNPRLDRISDLRCYPDVQSLPEIPDVGIVLLGVDRAQHAVGELAKLGVAATIVLASGYAETGPEGLIRQRELSAAAGDMRLLGPNTIGLVNLTDRVSLSASAALEVSQLEAGTIAVVSQSGGILGSLLSRAAARGIGLSKLVSTSNEADLEVADFVEYLADDPATAVITLYIEGLRNPDKFRLAALKAAASGKRIVAFKVGRSKQGAQAAVSHTGALAGTDRMYDAFFKRLGIIRATQFSDLLGISAALATGKRLSGTRVAIVTSTGGAGTLVSDALGVAGFETPPPDEATAAPLRALKLGGHTVLDRNPIDVTLAGLRPDLLQQIVRTLLASSSYDAIVLVAGSSSLVTPDLMGKVVSECVSDSDKPVLSYISPHAPDVGIQLHKHGVPAFDAPEGCATALDAMLAVSEGTGLTVGPERGPEVDISSFPSGALDEAEAKRLFAGFNIPVVRERIVATGEEARQAARHFGERVALKVLSKDITHKSDVGGVALNLTADDIEARMVAMSAEVAQKTGIVPKRFLVQPIIANGIEFILGLQRDTLGLAVLLGAGGIATELFSDTSLRMMSPGRGLSREEALRLARDLKAWPLLTGFRGRPKADIEGLVTAIVAFSLMAAQLGERILGAEINPLFVLPEGQGVIAADGVVLLS
jgi:acetate---CoA ligase (ADP-forming)